MSLWLSLLLSLVSLTAVGADLQPLVDGLDQDVAAFRQAQAVTMAQKTQQAEQLRQQVADLQQALEQQQTEQRQQELHLQSQREALAHLQQRLQQQGAQLNAVAGVVRRHAARQAESYRQSLTALQLGARPALFDALTDQTRLPDGALLARWSQLLRQQLNHSGRSETFKAKVIATDGRETERTVLRLGEFNLIDQQGYLLPGAGFDALIRLQRLPAGTKPAQLAALVQGEVPLVDLALDPTRGELLSRLDEQRPWYRRLEQAGMVGALIGLLFAAGIAVALERSWVLLRSRRQIRRQLRQAQPVADNVLGRILLIGHQNRRLAPEQLERKLDEAILAELPSLEKRLSLLKLFSAMAPMLGLLGTVTGMIATFQNITLFGSGDPRLMAGGIATALMTTVLGLIAAMPLMLLHSWLSGHSRELVNILDQQSAGLLARQLEPQEPPR